MVAAAVPYTVPDMGCEDQKCPVCHQQFKTNYQLRRHMDIHKGSGHPCSSCHKSLSSCKMLGQHEAACKQGRKHICTLCNKEYSSAQILKTHEKVHHGATQPQPGQSFPCPHCGKAYLVKKSMRETCWHLCSKSLQKGALLLQGGGLPQGKASLPQDEEPELPSGRSSWLEGVQGVNSAGAADRCNWSPVPP